MTLEQIQEIYDTIAWREDHKWPEMTFDQRKAHEYLQQYHYYKEDKDLFTKLVIKKVEELGETDLVILFNPIPSWDEFKFEIVYTKDGSFNWTNHDRIRCVMGAWTTNFTYVMHRYDGPEHVVPVRRNPSNEFLIPNLGGG